MERLGRISSGEKEEREERERGRGEGEGGKEGKKEEVKDIN